MFRPDYSGGRPPDWSDIKLPCCVLCLDLTIVEADPQTGQVRAEDVVSALRPTSKLVSLVLANNETGVLQPVREVVRLVREWQGKGEGRTVFVHTDAAQVRNLVYM